MGQILTIILFTSKVRIAIGIILAAAQLAGWIIFRVLGEYSFFPCFGTSVLVGTCIFAFFAMIKQDSRYRLGQARWWQWLRAIAFMSVFGWFMILGFICIEHAEKKRRRKCTGLQTMD